jgi:hypothetical protein
MTAAELKCDDIAKGKVSRDTEELGLSGSWPINPARV